MRLPIIQTGEILRKITRSGKFIRYENGNDSMKYSEIVADKLSAAGWSWGYCSAVTRDGWRCWSGCGSGLSGEGDCDGPQFREISIELMIDSAAFAAVDAELMCGIALHQTEIKPHKTLIP
jgi:hypothetical protein